MEPKPSSVEDSAGPLVSTDWLAGKLGVPRVRVLDVRGRHASSSLPRAHERWRL
jgi:hypothetical protein